MSRRDAYCYDSYKERPKNGAIMSHVCYGRIIVGRRINKGCTSLQVDIVADEPLEPSNFRRSGEAGSTRAVSSFAKDMSPWHRRFVLLGLPRKFV